MSTEIPRTIRSSIVAHDVDQAREVLEQAYNGERFSLEPTTEMFVHRFSSVGDRDVTLRANLVAGAIHGTIQTHGEYVLSWITAGEGAMDLSGDAVHLVPGQPAMFINGRPNEFDFKNHRQNLMHFDASFLEDVAADREGLTGPLLFDTTSRPTGDALRKWAATVASVAAVITDDSSTALLRSEANRAAAVALLDTFPHVALEAATETSTPSSSRMRAAVDFIHAHAHLPLRIETIADAAGTSTRSLQDAFRREMETTPLDYLRRIRLDHVRHELRIADPTTSTVGDIANRWGFAHLGRFSGAYADRFGELPRNTLDS